MDIKTPRGRESLKAEHRAMEIFAKHFPDYEYCETPKDKPADIDAFLIKQNQIMRVVETKCRDMTIEEFIGRYNYQWLVVSCSVVEHSFNTCSTSVALLIFLRSADALPALDFFSRNARYSEIS